MPGFGIDYQAPTIVAPDLVVNVPEITLPDRINTSKSPPEKDLPPVNDVLLPTVTPDWFGLRSQSAKTAITHPVLSDIVRRGDKSFEDKTLAINNFDAAVAEDIASKPVLSRNKDAATRKLDADVLIAKSELLNNRMAARRKELFPTYEEQNAFAKAVATGGDNPDAYTDPNQKTYVEEHNKLVKDLIGPGTRSWEAKASDPGGHEVAQYTVKPTASGDAIAFIKTQGALKPAQDTSPLAAILTGVPADQVANPQEDKGWDTHSDVIRFKMPTKEDQFAEQYKTTKRLDELKGEIEAAKNKIEQFSKKPEPTFGSILARATVGFGGGGAPGIDTASAAVMSNQQLLDSLTAEQKNLTKRMSDLTKDGIRVLANERVAEAIKADPKLMSQIPDKGRLEQLITGFRNQAVQMNVLLEQMGVPGYAGSLDAAAELARLDAINGTGGEQSKFRGTLVDELTNITVDSAPGMLMAALTTKGVGGLLSKSLAEAGGLAAGRAQMMGTTYSQSLVSAELTARGMEDSGDHAGAQQLRDSMQAGSLFNGIMEGVGGSIFPGDELALLKSWKGSFGKQAARAISSAAQNTIEEGVTQIGQNWTNPYTSGQPDPGAFSRDTAMAMAAGGVGGFIHQVALAPFNQEKTREENIAAVGKQLEEYAKNLGVNIHETPPEQVDIHSELVTSPADGKTQVQNIRQMIAPSGDQKNWTMGDESWRQRAFQAGVKSEFTSEEEARQFAATAQQQIVTAEFRNSLKETKVAPDLVEPMLNWIGLTIKQQAIANKQDTNTTWARYGYAHQAEILREAERAVTGTSSNPSGGTEQPSPETSPAPETKPSAQNGKEEEKGKTLLAPKNRSSPAVESAQAIENTLTGEERIRQSAVGGKLLADRLRAQEQAEAESPDMRAAWEKRRAHAIAMQDQEPAYVSDAQGHPAVTTVLTALDAYDAAKTDEDKLQVLDDVKPATVAAAERIAENTIAKIEADESLNDEEKKTMSEKWWKFAEDIKAIRVAAPESSFVKQEAPAPATADQTAASTEAVNASQESSPPAQEPSLPAAAPVGETSIPATVENATPPNDWINEGLKRDGYDPESMGLRLVDVGQQHIREAVMLDPNMSDEEKANVIGTGSKKTPPPNTKAAKGVEEARVWMKKNPPTQQAQLQAGRQAIKKQAAQRPESNKSSTTVTKKSDNSASVTKTSAPRVGQQVSFKTEGVVHTGKYLGPVASVPGMSRVQVGDRVMDARNGSIAQNTEGVALFQGGGEVIGGSAAIIGDRTTSGGTLGAVRITFSSKANASTVMHEQIHALGLLESPLADGSTISALESILGKDKSKALYSWAMQGTDDMSPVDAFTRTHERIAEGFEKWLTEGRLPKGKGYLAGAFNSIRVAMRNIVNGMINPDSRFSYIDPKAALPQGVQEAYQQLFSMLENKPVTQSDKPVSVFDSMVKTANSSMNALYPFTVAGEAGRTAMSAKQIADHFAIPADDPERENDPRVVASLAEARVNVQRANAGFTLFQMQGPDQLPNEKAKELIDVALPTVISAQEDGGKGIAGWLQYLKKINSPILNELTPGAREALYQATLLNIPSYEALAAQERIDAAIAAATNNEEVSEADFSRAIESVIPSLSPNIASLVKRIAGNTITGVDRKNALTAVMRAVRVDARSKFNTASNNLTQLLRGYRAGSKNSSHIKDIISEINKVIRPLLNSKEIGKNTKKTIEQTMLFVDFATHGRPEIADIVTMMQRNINSIREDLARNAQAAFIKGARAGGKYENAQFAARQEALIKTIEAELKTVSGMTPARISQVMKTLRGAKSDKALSKATWKALLLFQDQRVRDAYAEVEARQERIKANMKAGKFGELNYLVAEFNNYDPDSIPQHMLAQYSDLARKLSGSEPVILLAGVKNQIEDINDQLDAWLEANPFESKVRAETLRDGFDEAMQRLSALEEFDAAKAARSRDSFITKQQEMGKDLRRAEMAARMIDEHGVFQAFEEADEDELADFSPRQITGLANSFRNYNEGIVTPYLFKQSMALRSQRMQKVWMPMMQHGVRQFLYMKADTPLTEESADLRAGGIMKQLGRRLAGFGQYFGDKPTGKNIRAQFDSHDHLRYDALMGTFNWMNENVVIPMQQAQVAGLKLRNEIMHNKDASGRTMRDYQYIFQGTLEGHEIVKPFLDLTLFSNMVAGKKDIPFLSKLAHTQEAWREMWSRIAGIYMIQRQRESNDMPGTHYADFMANGAPSRKDSQAAINEERRQIAAIKAIRALLDATYQKRKEKAQGGMQKDSRAVDLTSMSAANIREILPPEVKSAIALADTNFGLTGEMTRLLNLFESEAPLPMPVNYFPIHGMDDNMSLKAKVDLLKGPMQDHGVPSTPRADARHARTDERLKFQNADFFGVHQDAVHAAAVDSAMTPFLKLVNMSMNGMMRQKEGEPPAFAGTAGNVVANLRDTMLEYGARYAHAVTTDPGVVRTLKGVALGLIYRMHLPQAFRPLQETLQNLTLLLGSTHAAAFKRGSAEFGKLGLGQDRFWDKVMIDLNAPTAARGTTEATIGLLHASMDDSLSALEGENAHIPGTIEAFFKDASQKPLAERGGVARLQSHRAAQVVKATSDLTVTVAEKAFTHQLWTGVFIKSLEDQTGHAFSRDKMDSYSPEQKQKALAAAELAVTEILAPSARGATRLKAQTPLDETTANIVLKNMVYALTSFTGAISTTAKMSVKAMVEGRAGLMDRTDGARNIAAIVGSGVVGSAISAAILAGVPGLIAGAMAKLHPDDDDDPTNDAENTAKKLADSGAYQRLRKLYHGMWPFDNGVGNTGKFWFNRFMQAAFQSRFGGTDSISRLAAATGAEALNYLGVNLASRMGLGSPYDPYRDNFTQEGIPALTAGTLLAFGSEDPQLRRAFQNSNIMDMSRVLGPISAALAFGVAIKEDAQLISRGLHGEGNMAPAALDALVQIGLLTNTLPLYKTLMQSTKALKDMDSTDFKTYSGGIKDKDAKRLGVDLFYASPESKPAIEAQLEALDDYHYGLAMKENLKLTSFKEAYTVPDDPALSAILKSKLERIRDGSSSQLPERIVAAYIDLEKTSASVAAKTGKDPHYEDELIRSIRYLMLPRKGWEGHFTVPTSQGTPGAEILQAKEIELRKDGQTPVSDALHGMMKWW